MSIKLRLIFKKHGEVTKRNLMIDDCKDDQIWKKANKEVQKRWPELKGTMQELELRK